MEARLDRAVASTLVTVRRLGGALFRLDEELPLRAPAGGGLAAAVAERPDCRGPGFGTPEVREALALADLLATLPRHLSVHPCGVVVADRDLATPPVRLRERVEEVLPEDDGG